MQKDLAEIEAAGIRIVGVSYDSVDVLKEFSEQRGITFRLLSDPDIKVINAYAVRNKEAAPQTGGVPYPGTMIIGQDGLVRAKLFLEGYRDRHTTDQLLRAAKKAK